MDDWLKEELENIGVFEITPMAPESIVNILERHEEEGDVTLKVSEVLAWLEHDAQLVEALNGIMKLNYARFQLSPKMKRDYPELYNYIDQLYSIANIITNRNSTVTIKLRSHVSDSSPSS